MDWRFTPFAAPLFVGASLMLILAVLAWHQRPTRGSVVFAALSLALAVYVAGYAFEVSSTSLGAVRLWLKIEYLGMTSGPPLVLLLTLTYTHHERSLTPLGMVLLFVIPATTCLLAWTNETHQLIWRNLSIDPSGNFTRTLFERGPWYWVQTAYTYLMLLPALALVARSVFRSSGVHRRQVATISAGLLIGVGGNLVYLTGHVFPGLDLNPYTMVLVATVMAWGVLNYGLLDRVPMARQAVVAAMQDAVLVTNREGQIIDLNPAAQKLVGSTLAECLGAPLKDVLPEVANLLTIPTSAAPASTSLILTVGGQARYFDANVAPLMARPGKEEGSLLVLRDITDRVRAELGLRQAHQRLNTLRRMEGELTRRLDVNYVASIAADAALRLSLADAALIALAEGEWFRIVHAIGSYPVSMRDTLLSVERGIAARVVRTLQPDLTLDVTSDPDYRCLIPETRAQITMPLVSGDRPIGVLVLETAHPERFSPEVFETIKLLAARIAAAMANSALYEERDLLARELDAFAHTVAHDLKNPLGVIMNYVDLLTDGHPIALDDLAMYLQPIQNSARKAVGIIEALLTLARARSARDVEVTGLDMAGPVGEACERLRVQIEASKATLRLPESWPVALGYAPWVEEVWVNYLSNALKYGGQPPVVELGWDAPSESCLRFWVQDNGQGLAAEQIRQLFRPFSRLNAQHQEGHGLGLTIVQRIVERLGGTVGVESQVGQGSRFYFTLPAPPGGQPLG